MPDETPCAIPTTTTPTSLSFWARTIRTDHPESPQLLTLLIAAFALVAGLALVIASCVRWIWSHGDLGSGACWALGLAISSLALLAGYSSGFALPIAPRPNDCPPGSPGAAVASCAPRAGGDQ